MPNPKRRSTPASQLRPGARVRVTANSNSHNYTIGKVYVLTEETRGSGFRARDEQTGETGNWLDCDDMELVPGIGWEWLATVLPKADLELLSAFDGLMGLALKPEVKEAIINQIDGLAPIIPRVHRALERKDRP